MQPDLAPHSSGAWEQTNRHPAGTPNGGRFAPAPHGEGEVTLTAADTYDHAATLWFHSRHGDIPTGTPIHLGTAQAAADRAEYMARDWTQTEPGRTYPIRVVGPMRNTPDTAVGDAVANYLSSGPHMLGTWMTPEQERDFHAAITADGVAPQFLADFASVMGREGGLYYRNHTEDAGSISVVVPDSSWLLIDATVETPDEDLPVYQRGYLDDETCPDCGGEMTWCTSCNQWSKDCCEPWGTCMCS